MKRTQRKMLLNSFSNKLAFEMGQKVLEFARKKELCIGIK